MVALAVGLQKAVLTLVCALAAAEVPFSRYLVGIQNHTSPPVTLEPVVVKYIWFGWFPMRLIRIYTHRGSYWLNAPLRLENVVASATFALCLRRLPDTVDDVWGVHCTAATTCRTASIKPQHLLVDDLDVDMLACI